MSKHFKKPKPIKKAKPDSKLRDKDIVATAGFRSFSQTAHDELPDFFRSVSPLTAVINKFRNAPVNGKVARVIHSMAALVSNSFGALVVLGLNGYGHDAMRITRSMFETMVNAKYIKLHPEEVEDYLDFHLVRKMETYEYFKKYAPGELADIPEEKVRGLMVEFEAIKGRFMNKNGQLRKTWCRTGFRTCAEAVGLAEYYPTFYAEASDFEHGNIQAVIGQTEESLVIAAAPSLGSMNKALEIGHLSVIGILGVLNDVATLGFDEDMKTAMLNFQRAWHQQAPAA
jgi:hypothetical protein